MRITSGVTGANSSASRPSGHERWQRHAVSLLGAVVVGVVSLLANEYLPPGPDLIGHSAALWLAFAFYLGARSDHGVDAVAAGMFGLISVVLVYYGSLRLFTGRADFPTVEKFWLLAAVIGGPIFGGLGHLCRSRRAVLSGFAAAALGAVFIAEAVNYRSLGNAGAALTVEAIVGALLPFAIVRGRKRVLAALVCLPALLLLGLAAFEVTNQLFWHVS